MEAAGLRPAHDIDIVAKPELFNELIKQGWHICDCEKCQKTDRKMLKTAEVDIYSDYSCGDKYEADVDVIIDNAEMIEGLPFLQMSDLLNWKTASGRPKDLADIKLIKKYLASQ